MVILFREMIVGWAPFIQTDAPDRQSTFLNRDPPHKQRKVCQTATHPPLGRLMDRWLLIHPVR